MNNYLVLDLETDGLDWQTDPIIAVGYKAYDVPFVDSEYASNVTGLKKYFEPYNLLIGHNISFDLLFLWKYKELQDWLKAGGQIWDTQLAHYMLSGQQEKYPALREIATRVYGCPDRIKWIDDLLFNNKNAPIGLKVSDLPRDKVLEDVQNDVLDTEQVYLQQRKLAQRYKMERLIELQMDALLATTEMRFNGMQVDREVLNRNKQSLEIDLEQKQKELQVLVSKYWK